MSHYHDDHDTGFPEDAKQWIDEKVHGGLKSAYGGGLQVLASGFGKGALIAAAITAVAFAGLAVAAPTVIGLAAGGSVASAIPAGLMAATNFLFSGGIIVPILGGTIGSLVASHNDKERLSQESAEAQAIAYAQARECKRGDDLSPGMEMGEDPCPGLPSGHCAKLMQGGKDASMRGAAR